MDTVENKSGPGTTAPVANGAPTGQTGNAPAPVPARQSAPFFGGLRGGRAREDGLKPGSPEAQAADRDRDRQRKQRARETARLANPPPLPSVDAPMPGPIPSAVNGDSVDVPVAPVVPWDAQVLKPFIVEAVNVSETARVSQFKSQSEEAQLPAQLVKLICEDAKYVPAFKNTVVLSAPNVLARLLNRTGISGKYSDEAILGLAVLSIWMHGRRMHAKLDKLIEEHKAKQGKETKP